MNKGSIGSLAILRAIISELRLNNEGFTKNNEVLRYLLRKIRNKSNNICSCTDNELHLASTYYYYLSSTRRLQDLHEKYQTGERTVEQSARLVGLELPNMETKGEKKA